LRELDDAGGWRAYSREIPRRVVRGEIDGVERVQELGTELQFEAFRKLEVLLQADVPVVISRSTQPAKLRRTGSKGRRWVGIVVGIKPEKSSADSCRGFTPSVHSVRAVAIGAQTTRLSSRWINRVCTEAQRETGVKREDWTDGPAANNGIQGFAQVATELFPSADG
jgi:hypothetical protein